MGGSLLKTAEVQASGGPGTPLRQTTAKRYREITRLHLIPSLGHHRLGELRPGHVEAALRAAIARGMSLAMADHCRAVLRTALGAAEREGLVVRNAARLAQGIPTYRAPKVRVYSLGQVQRLLDAITDHPLEPLILFSLHTGCRQGGLAKTGRGWHYLFTTDRPLRPAVGILDHVPSGRRSVAAWPSTDGERLASPASLSQRMRPHTVLRCSPGVGSSGAGLSRTNKSGPSPLA